MKEERMKNATWIGCLLMMIVGSSPLMAVNKEFLKSKRCSAFQILRIPDLNEEVIQEFSQGNLSDYILECPEGAAMPFKIAITGEFLALEPAETAPYHLRVLKTCYVRCEEQGNF